MPNENPLKRVRDWAERETGEQLSAEECWLAVQYLETMSAELGTVPEYRAEPAP